ncbi:MAG: tetratricopeptide repeat protein [Candidatus Polarisedimenticolia bacterium]
MSGLRLLRSFMSLRRPLATAALAAFAAGASGCASPSKVTPVGSFGPAFALEKDEQRLWERAREEERKLRGEAPLYGDPILEDYLNQVAQRLVPPEVRGQSVLKLRVHTIRDPSLNAFTYPNGSIYVHTGLLARLEDEAMLATVLAHEITHATHRHALKHERSTRNKAIGFTIASLAASVLIAAEAGERAQEGSWKDAYIINQVGNILVGLGLQLGFLAAVHGFGRDLEREADDVGLARMVAAGYDPRRAPRVFEILKDDHGDPSKAEVFFFGSHPALQERIASTREIVATRYASAAAESRVTDTRDFRMRMRVLVRDDAAQNIDAGRNHLAQTALDRVLELTPNDPIARVLYGRLHEKRAAAAPPEEARALNRRAMADYEEALRIDPRNAEALRARGILLYKTGRRTEALSAFRAFLEVRPDGPESQQIKDYILELEAP